jgi:hypothetical protein
MLATVGLAACAGGDDTDTGTPAPSDNSGASADTMEATVEELGKASTDVVSLVVSGMRSSIVEECLPTFGTCSLCYSLVGGLAGGDVTAVTDPPGCGETYTGTYGSAVYVVNGSELAGTWLRNADGTYTVSLTGSRDGSIAVDGSGAAAATVDVDSSWTLDTLVVTVTTELEIVSYATSITYDGLGSSAWTLDVSGDATTITGTVTMDAGSCTVTGSVENVDVDCAGA